MKQEIKEELSAGGVVYRPISGNAKSEIRNSRNFEFLIGKHSGYHKWVLPKGLIEKGEGPIETTRREIEEEVGVRARIVELVPIKMIEYWYRAELGVKSGMGADGKRAERRVKKYQEDGQGKTRVHKRVIFYLMELEEDLGKPGWEMEERRWVSFEEGMKMLAFETEREVLESAHKLLSSNG